MPSSVLFIEFVLCSPLIMFQFYIYVHFNIFFFFFVTVNSYTTESIQKPLDGILKLESNSNAALGRGEQIEGES